MLPKKISALIILIVSSGVSQSWANKPDPNFTPGLLCSPQDVDFSGYNPPGVAICKRDVTTEKKMKIAQHYGVPRADWSKYEFDHLIPVCIGGSSDIRNIWPEPLDDAHRKDLLEDRLCNDLRAGRINQADAVKEMLDYTEQNG